MNAPVSRIAPVVSLALLAAACGGGDDAAELARLRSENEELRERVTQAEAPPTEVPAGATVLESPELTMQVPEEVVPARPLALEDAPPAVRPRESRPVDRFERPEPAVPAAEPRADRLPQPGEREAAPPRPAEAAAPSPVAEQPQARVAAAGTPLALRLTTGLHSGENEVGDPVEAVLERDLLGVNGELVLPVGTRLTGTLTDVQRARKVKRKSRLAFHLDTAHLPDGRQVSVRAGRKLEGEGYTKRDGAVIGGAAAGGAILGQVLGGDSEATAAGAVLGGAIGSGVLMSKRGEDVVIPAGTLVDLPLEVPVEVRPSGA